MGPLWAPQIDQKSISGGKVGRRGVVFTVVFNFSVYANVLLRFGSIFEGPDPQKVMTLTGIGHFSNFQVFPEKKHATSTPKSLKDRPKSAENRPKVAPGGPRAPTATQKRRATGNRRRATGTGSVPSRNFPLVCPQGSSQDPQARFPYIKADIYQYTYI